MQHVPQGESDPTTVGSALHKTVGHTGTPSVQRQPASLAPTQTQPVTLPERTSGTQGHRRGAPSSAVLGLQRLFSLDQPPWQMPGSRPSLSLLEPGAHLSWATSTRGEESRLTLLCPNGVPASLADVPGALSTLSPQPGEVAVRRPCHLWRPAPHPRCVPPTLVPMEQRLCDQNKMVYKTHVCGCQ